MLFLVVAIVWVVLHDLVHDRDKQRLEKEKKNGQEEQKECTCIYCLDLVLKGLWICSENSKYFTMRCPGMQSLLYIHVNNFDQ